MRARRVLPIASKSAKHRVCIISLDLYDELIIF